MKLGFIGLGIMGTPMAVNLARAGHQLHVTTIGPVAEELLALGAVNVETARQVTESSDIIFIMVPDTPQVEEVLFGENGCAKTSLKGKTIVDMSSISPIETKRFARQVNELGGDYLDAPVSGGEIGAREGTLSMFLGYTPAVARDENVWFASSLDEAARLACLLSRVTARRNAIAPVSSGFICGLYTGGTLAAEAAGLLAGHLGVEADDTHHHGMMLDADGHQIIDLGDDFYTVGRPHPMIDPALRNQLIADLGAKPQVRVLLLDVVIGFGATADPAASLVSAWQKACAARSDNQPLYAIATVTGTERDPQCRSQQIATLEDAGIAVVSSLPEATLLAAALIRPLSPATQQHTPSLMENVAVINIGLRSFALELQSASKPVVHYQWSPVAGGNKKLARLLERLQ
ncbi:TPA: acyl-CoA synthetase FdrA [Escherichia coli]|nr:acyl-CoA synthetase FdrA [Escherichia coli]HBA9353720.1 acyl-CoA synthetase FdrA [Escherichia coli]HBA9381023.1 acyl-CoA synthetase FdrA [Escherichia coli]